MANEVSPSAWVNMSESVMGRIYHYFTGHDSSTETRIFLIFVLAVSAHVLVMAVRHLSEWMIYKEHARKSPLGYVAQKPKFITVTRLAVSTVTFAIYFLAFGLILQEFKVDLTAYLASASVIGLAISFGLQGLIQDIVIGLTLIFWDTMDVGDMVEIYSGTYVIGRVTEIGLRFTKLVNFYNQVVLVPNRTIANVSRFPHGGVDAYADAEIPAESDPAKAVQVVGDVARGMWRQFGAIILSEPVIGAVEKAQGEGWSYSRVHFKIWPGQGNLIETTFRQQVVRAMKSFDPNYAEWRVPVTYRSNTDVKKLDSWF